MSNKPSFYNATRHLIELMERIDNADDLTTELINEFSSAKIDVSEAIDRRRYVMNECETRIDAAKKMVVEIKDHIKRLEKVQDKIKYSTMCAMQLNPDMTYQDSLGRKIQIKSSQPKLEIDLDTKTTSVSNCLNTSLMARDDIVEYVEPRTYYVLNTEKVKKDLQEGKQISWAKLTQSEYLKGL